MSTHLLPCTGVSQHVSILNSHTAHCTLHTTLCKLHTVHYTLHTAHFTLHTAYCTLHTAHCTLHNPQATLGCLADIVIVMNFKGPRPFGSLACKYVNGPVEIHYNNELRQTPYCTLQKTILFFNFQLSPSNCHTTQQFIQTSNCSLK